MALPPPPWNVPLIEDLKARLIGRANWGQWVLAVHNAVSRAAQQVGIALGLTTQAASLAATTVLTVPATGLYRVTYYARITQAASSSSSLAVTVRWTDGGVAQAASGALLNGNTTATSQSGGFLVQADKDTGITVEAARLSSGVTPMQYTLVTRVEALP